MLRRSGSTGRSVNLSLNLSRRADHQHRSIDVREGIIADGRDMAGGREREGISLAARDSVCAAPPTSSARYAPLGLRVDADADDPALLDALEATLAGWQGEPDLPHAMLRLSLRTDAHGGALEPSSISVEGPVLRLAGAGVQGEADARTGTARAVLSSGWHTDPSALRDHVIEPLLLFLLTRAGRTPIHATGLVVGELGLLLAGPAGSGKSCLALAGHAAGFALLSDDLVYVQSEPALRAWGVPRPVHLFERDAGGRIGPTRLRQGKSKRAITLPATSVAPRRLALVLLRPGKAVSLDPISSRAALRAMARLEPGFDLLADDILRVTKRIAKHGAWRLGLSHDPHEAIALLARALPALSASAAA